jgi:ligand-binding sensor domain-containing protein
MANSTWNIAGCFFGLWAFLPVGWATINTIDQPPFAAKQDTTQPGIHSIDAIFQDSHNHYWIATNGNGVYYHNGKTIQHYTVADGLPSDAVWTIQEDARHTLWFSTRDGFAQFDGSGFRDLTYLIHNAPYGHPVLNQKGIFFPQLNGVCYYDGFTFTNLRLTPSDYKDPETNLYRPYGVYCTLLDSNGTLYLGTQEKGICIKTGTTLRFLTEHDLAGPAVRVIFKDSKGILWFGNNGGGLFRYDGTTLRNITEEQNLGNAAFLHGKKLVDKPGSLARVFAINEDNSGNLWIGTPDAGVWKMDPAGRLSNYTEKDGLSGNSVTGIFKERNGELLFVSNGDSISTFDGKRFVHFDP